MIEALHIILNIQAYTKTVLKTERCQEPFYFTITANKAIVLLFNFFL